MHSTAKCKSSWDVRSSRWAKALRATSAGFEWAHNLGLQRGVPIPRSRPSENPHQQQGKVAQKEDVSERSLIHHPVWMMQVAGLSLAGIVFLLFEKASRRKAHSEGRLSCLYACVTYLEAFILQNLLDGYSFSSLRQRCL